MTAVITETLRIGETEVDLYNQGTTVSRMPGGRELAAHPENTDEYREAARNIGYEDAGLCSREHEIAHSLLAKWLGQDMSPTLASVADGENYAYWREEEAAVMAIQRFARALGVSLVGLARNAERSEPL